VCEWLTPQIVRAAIGGSSEGADQCAVPGDEVSVAAGTRIRAQCQHGDSAQLCSALPTAAPGEPVTVQAPTADSLLSPTVVVSTASVAGACSSVTIDATNSAGSGGRAWAASSISVLQTTGISNAVLLAELQAFLDASFDPSFALQVPAALVPKGAALAFSVTLHTFLGAAGQGAAQVVVRQQNVPTVRLAGQQSRQLVAAKALAVSTEVAYSQCPGDNSSVAVYGYSWQVWRGAVAELSLVSDSSDPSKFSLPAYSLVPGASYRVVVTVALLAAPELSSSTELRLFVKAAGVLAEVAGAPKRDIRPLQTASVDASFSRDLNLDPVRHVRCWN
jgi:hypothetical protein